MRPESPQMPRVMTALVTPFRGPNTGTEEIDVGALIQHAEEQIRAQVALLGLGTTGEAQALSDAEREVLVRELVRIAHGRVPIFIGVSGNNTADSIRWAQQAEALGADGILISPCSYVKQNQQDVIAQIGAVLESTRLPGMAYNIPGRTAVNIAPDTLARIADRHPNLLHLKEANPEVEHIDAMVQRMQDHLHIWSGNDDMVPAFAERGHSSVVSVASNVVPGEMHDLMKELARGPQGNSTDRFARLEPLMKALFPKDWSSPRSVKWALGRLGRMSGKVRLPLTTLPDDSQTASDLEKALRDLRLLR